jgi:hypothetical protein
VFIRPYSYVGTLSRGTLIAAALLFGVATPGRAQQSSSSQQQPPPQQPPPTQQPPTQPPPATPPATSPPPDQTSSSGDPNRIFGVLPNYTSVEKGSEGTIGPITNKDAFKMATLDSFDPFVYPLFGFIAGVNQATDNPAVWKQDMAGYAKRYGVAFADNTVCSLITTGVLPSLLQQDPRYFQKGTGSFLYRVGYSASRSVVTHSRKEHHRQFNLSEIGGTLLVATISNLYYPETERNTHDTLLRWGSQAMWDTVANELKEFWPDIRRKVWKK